MGPDPNKNFGHWIPHGRLWAETWHNMCMLHSHCLGKSGLCVTPHEGGGESIKKVGCVDTDASVLILYLCPFPLVIQMCVLTTLL